MASRRQLALALVLGSVMLLSLGAAPALAATTQPLSLTLDGIIMTPGTQIYDQGGGQLLVGQVFGYTVDPSTAHLSYSLHATVSGASVQGSADLHLVAKTTTGLQLNLIGTATIVGAYGLCFPSYSSGSCLTTDTGIIPSLFVAMASLKLVGGVAHDKSVAVPMLFESAYLNPWGNPTLIASADPSNPLLIAATYDRGQVQWSGVLVGGNVVEPSSLGSTSATGQFSLTTNSRENLVSGVEQDSGAISFFSMTPSSLNGQGPSGGTTTIPTAGSFDCSGDLLSLMGLPSGLLPFPICTATGATSNGHFKIVNSQLSIKGSYLTEWSVPSLTFTTYVTATATSA